MWKRMKSKQESTATEPEEEEEQYLTYNFNVQGDVHITIHDCDDVRIMSGQPSQPTPKPPGT